MADPEDDAKAAKLNLISTNDNITSDVPVEAQCQSEDKYKITDAVIATGMSVHVDSSMMSTLQSLLASPINQVAGTGEQTPVQIIAAAPPSDVLASAPTLWSGNVWQIVHNPFSPEIATIVAINAADIQTVRQSGSDVTSSPADSSTGQVESIYSTNGAIAIPVRIPQPLPPDCPNWASRLKDCERIGDFYRGYVESEVELDRLLTFHKQQTQSFWGTRQSPNLSKKPSTRLMWKSQYVPFDGIPFINNGSRAVVMECQYGPRRKGVPQKNQTEPMPRDYKQTCPARIYVKRVKKFPEFAVEHHDVDRKILKMSMDRAFGQLRNNPDFGVLGQERHYVQLPTEEAHEFHYNTFDEESEVKCLDSRVSEKIREIVASGETRVYAIRKALRRYMTKMLMSKGSSPERHDLKCFPTVNDLKNHIHQAVTDIENGTLPLTASQVNVEVISDLPEHSKIFSNVEEMLQSPAPEETNMADGGPIPETVTVTLTPNPDQDGRHIISRIETHLSDGSTQIRSSLTLETAQLLSKLHPAMFPAESLRDMFQTENPSYEDSETDTSHLPTMVSQATLSSNSIPTRVSPDLIPPSSFIPTSSSTRINNPSNSTTGHLVSSSSTTATSCDNLISIRGGAQLAIPTVQAVSSSSDSLHEGYTLKYDSQPSDHLTTRTIDYTLPADQLILASAQGMDEDLTDLPTTSRMIVTSASENLLSMISAKQLELSESGQDDEITLQIVQPNEEYNEERSMIIMVRQFPDESGIENDLTQPSNDNTSNILQIDSS